VVGGGYGNVGVARLGVASCGAYIQLGFRAGCRGFCAVTVLVFYSQKIAGL